MKTLRVWIATVIVLLTFVSTRTTAGVEPVRMDSSGRTTESAEARIILARLEEIDAIDLTHLSASEKRDLQKEVKTSKRRMNQIDGGVFSSYFSELMHRFTAAMHN